jgi:hypothetical protein
MDNEILTTRLIILAAEILVLWLLRPTKSQPERFPVIPEAGLL